MMQISLATEFAASPCVDSRLTCLDPQHLRASRNGVQLAGQPRYPEAVDHIASRYLYVDSPTRRDMKQTGGRVGAAEIVVAEGPAPSLGMSAYCYNISLRVREETLANHQTIGQ